MQKFRGFTLIELMIALVVLAVLAAIAIPSYREFILRSQRADATIALTEIANLQEKFYSDNLRYAATISDTPGNGLLYPLQSLNGLYNVSLVAVTTTVGYQIQAQATGAQLADTDCQTLTLNAVGQRGSSPAGPDTCWRR